MNLIRIPETALRCPPFPSARQLARFGVLACASDKNITNTCGCSLAAIRLITNDDASLVERHDYEPYGLELPPYVNQSANTHQFTGHERELTSGFDYMHFRYFGSTMGRFCKPDNVSGKLANPQSWNRYSYVVGNPVNFNDPTGHKWNIPGQHITTRGTYSWDVPPGSDAERISSYFYNMVDVLASINIPNMNDGSDSEIPVYDVTAPGSGQTQQSSEFLYKGTKYWYHRSEEPIYPFFSEWEKTGSVDIPIKGNLSWSAPVYGRNLYVSFTVKDWLTLPGSTAIVEGSLHLTIDKFYLVAHQSKVTSIGHIGTSWIKTRISGYDIKSMLKPVLSLVPTKHVPDNIPLANPLDAAIYSHFF